MVESKAVKFYIYFLVLTTIILGIGIFVFLITQESSSSPISMLSSPIIAAGIAIAFILFSFFEFFIRSNFFILKDFIQGNKPGVKFSIGIGIAGVLLSPVYYKYVTGRFGLIGFILFIILLFATMILAFWRLKEINRNTYDLA
tara:strand:- start:768 stop:1196 length:429 start_codon:yes stop_codon:yes gene_type:complete